MIRREGSLSWKRYLRVRYVAGKIQEKGVVWTFKAGLGIIFWGEPPAPVVNRPKQIHNVTLTRHFSSLMMNFCTDKE